ncbi:hypothetical protein ACRTDO_01430 [Vibrio furnissii]|uniref:hypothetical protein n=1 Tax=Vibrio furnissii TaxID=29494 RepID=UPI003D7DAFAE
MKQYPALHLEIAETAAGPGSPTWPAVQNFPRIHRDAIFSLPPARVSPAQPRIWVITLDLAKLAELIHRTLH